MTDGYTESIDLDRMERQLARCAALDVEQPARERCARKTVMQSICPCVMSEDTICNALSASISDEIEVG